MSSGPKPPDPMATSNQQEIFNVGAGTAQQNLNMVNQTTPYGSLSYNVVGYNADGTPRYSATQTQSPQVQSASDSLLNQINGPGQDFTGQQMKLYNQYYQPLINQSQDALNAKLATQGITPGSKAYNDAQNLQARNVGDQQTNWLLNSGQLGIAEQAQPYNLLTSLRTGAAPGFGSTPTTQIQPPNYTGAVEQNYQTQAAQQNALYQGLGSLGGAALGGWARGGFQTPSFG
jgi:hypothetical protein